MLDYCLFLSPSACLLCKESIIQLRVATPNFLQPNVNIHLGMDVKFQAIPDRIPGESKSIRI